MPGKPGQGRRYFPGFVNGKLTMIRLLGRNQSKHQYSVWRCECGNEVVMSTGNAVRRNKSCGCDLPGRVRTAPERRLYGVWKRVRQRCRSHPSYLSRAIGYDPRWDSFALFVQDMGSTYVPGYHIHRIDSTGPYHAANCVWLEPRAHFAEHHGDPKAKVVEASI